MLVLDTNVLSELMKPSPAPSVLAWINAQTTQSIYTTAVSEAEILVGIAVLPPGRRRDALQTIADRTFRRYRPTRILCFDSAAAAAFARIFAGRRILGRPMSTLDAQIAGIASANQATLVTRNVADFTDCGLTIVNPWQP